jgi:hypothetical protein
MTPTRPAMLQGQMHRRVATSALDPLTVTAMAIEAEDGRDCVVIVSFDLPFVDDGIKRRMAERVRAAAPELPPEKLLPVSTHTHTALVTTDGFYEHPGGEVMTAAEGEAWVAEKGAEAVIEAWKGRAPRMLDRAFGHAVVGHNRIALYDDGGNRMYGKTNNETFAAIAGYEDHSVDMLFIREPDGRLCGVALAIPCPSQVDEHLTQFSADYWHEVRVELRRRLGAALHVLPICSPAGDQSPHFLLYGAQEAEMRKRRGVTERQEIALRVADAVERALACTPADPAKSCPMAHRVVRTALTPWRVTKSERDWAESTRAAWIAKKGESTSWWPARLQSVVDVFEGREKPPPFLAELHFLRLGELAVASNPFELYLDYSMQIKARSPAAQTMLIQIAGMGWYLPSERVAKGGGYGAMPAVAKVGPEGGRELVRETLAGIAALFPTPPGAA